MFPCVSWIGASRESPKSETFAVNLESNNILVAFTSRWNIGGSTSVCRYRRPLADPRAIFNLMEKVRGFSE